MKILAVAIFALLAIPGKADETDYSILTDAEDGVPHRSGLKSNGQALLKPAFVQKIKASAGSSPFLEDLGDVVVQTTFLASTSSRHADHLPPDANGNRPPVPSGDRVGFLPLNTNKDAFFDVDDTCIPIEKNKLIHFDGSLPHHTVVNGGIVRFLGPFHVDSMKSVGCGSSGPGEGPDPCDGEDCGNQGGIVRGPKDVDPPAGWGDTDCTPECRATCRDDYDTVVQVKRCVIFECDCENYGQCETFGNSYCRLLSEYHLDGSDHELLTLVEGEEHTRHLKTYSDSNKDGMCDLSTSVFYGLEVTKEECFDPSGQIRVQDEMTEEDGEAWIHPSNDEAVQLADNIWSLGEFLNKYEVSKVHDLINKYGHDLGVFATCDKGKYLSLPGNPHPADKLCFRISSKDVCDGRAYDASSCDHKTDPADSAFVASLFSKVKGVWPVADEHYYPYAKVHLTTGSTPPVDLHYDNNPISTIVYLTDGGASLIFPNADLEITPKAGAAYTWVNKNMDGTRNPKADHAVQAHPESGGERLILMFDIIGSTEEVAASFS